MTTTGTTPAESKLHTPTGITIPIIDEVFAEVVVEVAQDRERFVLLESTRMALGAKLGREALFRETIQITQGVVRAADRAVVGYCFAHRLLQRSQPNNGAGLLDNAESMALRVAQLSKDTAKKYLPDIDTEVQYYRDLETRFSNNPTAFDHLLGKFTNMDSNTGAQILLLSASSILVADAIEMLPEL